MIVTWGILSPNSTHFKNTAINILISQTRWTIGQPLPAIWHLWSHQTASPHAKTECKISLQVTFQVSQPAPHFTEPYYKSIIPIKSISQWLRGQTVVYLMLYSWQEGQPGAPNFTLTTAHSAHTNLRSFGDRSQDLALYRLYRQWQSSYKSLWKDPLHHIKTPASAVHADLYGYEVEKCESEPQGKVRDWSIYIFGWYQFVFRVGHQGCGISAWFLPSGVILRFIDLDDWQTPLVLKPYSLPVFTIYHQRWGQKGHTQGFKDGKWCKSLGPFARYCAAIDWDSVQYWHHTSHEPNSTETVHGLHEWNRLFNGVLCAPNNSLGRLKGDDAVRIYEMSKVQAFIFLKNTSRTFFPILL